MISSTERAAIMRVFEDLGALWVYPGEPRSGQPHALLTSGLHSNGFFNGSALAAHPCQLACACHELVSLATDSQLIDTAHIDSVFGSAMGAITIAHEIAKQLGGKRFGFTEKDEGRMRLKRFSVQPNERVLVVEDVLTTGGTTVQTISALEAKGARVVQSILVLVNRSGSIKLDNRRIVSLVELEIQNWEEQDCPLCRAGSRVVRPKINWLELTGQLT